MIIKVDVDGVIRNMFDNMCKVYNRCFNEHMTVEDIFDYDVDIVFPRIREEIGISAADYFFKLYAYDLFLESKPYDGVKEALEKIRKEGHKVIIVTWQYTLDNKLNTLRFLDNNEIPYDDICFTRDKWMIQSDWIIDDNPEFLLDERETANKIIVNMPYNKYVKENKCIRVNNLSEAVDIISQHSIYVMKKRNERYETNNGS